MRFSTISCQVLSGAALTSAAAISHKRDGGLLGIIDKTVDAVDNTLDELIALPLSMFPQMETVSFEEAEAQLAAQNGTETESEPADFGTMSVTDAALPGGPCANPSIRVEWRNMKEADRQGFLNGVKCLMDKKPSGTFPAAKNRYEDIVSVHQQMTSKIHLNGMFLPWHRYYSWVFMRTMRQECGYTGPYPWWDETKDAGHFASSPLFTGAYFGSLPAATNGAGTCITNGAFAGRTLNVGPDTSNKAHCLARAVDEKSSAGVTQAYVDNCSARSTYMDYEGCNEKGPHGLGHNAVGAVMGNVAASPGDPIFFLHHAFVDRMWRKWQIKDDARLRGISGCASGDGTNGCATALTLDTKLTSMGLKEDRTVGEMLDIYNNLLCYLYDY